MSSTYAERVRSVDLVENKLRETDYFLERMGEAGFNVWAFQCDFTAFLASARSVTFTMQSRHVWPPRMGRLVRSEA
jgi:hypothetical protein